MKRTALILAALALALCFGGCASSDGFAGLRMIQMTPQVEAAIVCQAQRDGDCTTVDLLALDDVKTAYREHVVDPVQLTLRACGPLAAKLAVGGTPGRMLTANGRFEDGVFVATELTLKKGDLPSEYAAVVVSAAGQCQAKAKPKGEPEDAFFGAPVPTSLQFDKSIETAIEACYDTLDDVEVFIVESELYAANFPDCIDVEAGLAKARVTINNYYRRHSPPEGN